MTLLATTAAPVGALLLVRWGLAWLVGGDEHDLPLARLVGHTLLWIGVGGVPRTVADLVQLTL